ncbi:sugar kinase [Stappia sp. GBMRC 2046]|uniref:Sugar kinase n=1 Tax=Stappia sediminis TaxID=2692190 RepID=A0A7X3LSW2_9HYPH|nr:sugar kinase [Stappia sediminis]MXN64504.1 sugar kinase [Stappia sediminis]
MQALFIGQAYIDVTFLTDQLPVGDEKAIAEDYAISFGGNAVTAAFACAKLGIHPDLMCSQADDWLSRMFLDMAAKYGISIHGRKVHESSLSFIMPKEGKRAIVRCRDNNFLHPFQELNLTGCRALHLDGHMPDAALHYAKKCRNAGILTSLDGGTIRDNTMEILEFIDIAVVSELFCEKLGETPTHTLEFLRSKGCKVGGVTLGERGIHWFEGSGAIQFLPSLFVPADQIVDTNGAGDIFHGAYVYSYLAAPDRSWAEHFRFARAASTHSIRYLGNEASLPTLADVEAAAKSWREAD